MAIFSRDTILKWRQPGTVTSLEAAGLAAFRRIRRRTQGPFISGVIAGIVIVLAHGGVRATGKDRLLVFALTSSMGLCFAVVYGLASLVRPEIHIGRKGVHRQTGARSQHWYYADFRAFRFTIRQIAHVSVHYLELEEKGGDRILIELSARVPRPEIERVLTQKIYGGGDSA